MNSHITMEQIARKANVSITTVSRVLAGSACVAEATRKRVQALIDQYQFKPNPAAQSLTRQKSNTLGVLVQNIENAYFASLYMQAERTASTLGYSAILFNSLNPDGELRSIANMYERRVDGLILSTASVDTSYVNNPLLNSLKEFLSPDRVIVLNDPPAGYKGPWVYVAGANEQAYSLAARYLISLGHRRIAFVGGSTKLNLASLRLRAFQSEMRKAGLATPACYIQMSGYEVENGERDMIKVLSGGEFPTAVLATSDQIAMGAMRACLRQGLRIPRDISIISCDNTYIAKSLYPALTSIDIDPGGQGEMAIRILVRMIAGEDVPLVNTITPRLVIRDSTARPEETE